MIKPKILFKIPFMVYFLGWYPEYKLFVLLKKVFDPKLTPPYKWRVI